jgi:DMSO/TMAO reductase YedYZ molybdopterin-dependent catalytic subunit
MKPHVRSRAGVSAAALAFVLVVGSRTVAVASGQAAAVAADATLQIGGDIPKPFAITPAELKTMPRTAVTVSEEAKEVHYEGVLVGELLKRAGAPLGRELSGKALTTYVQATAKDGYQVVFSLAELDPAFTPNDIIVADTIDGKPLFDYQGPLRIVAPHDKRGARSIRMLQRIEVVRAVK